MTSLPAGADPRVARLERRLERERRARREAERIAEKGLRDLYLANVDLDQKVADRTTELDAARRAAHRASVERAQFLESLSREVRTPLNGVVGMLELLDDYVEDPQARTWLATASASANELTRLFARLVLFVQLDDPEPPVPSRFPIADVVENVAARWTRVAARAGLLLVTEDRSRGAEVESSYELLQRLLDELLQWIISAAAPGPLVVSATPGDAGGAEVILTHRRNLEAGDAPRPPDISRRLEQRLTDALGAEVTTRDSDGQTTVSLILG